MRPDSDEGTELAETAERTLRLAVLVSGRGSNLRALLDAVEADAGFGGAVVVVGSDRSHAPALDLARERGIDVVVHDPRDFADRRHWEHSLVEELVARDVDAVVLAGFMRVLSEHFLARWPDRVLNTHPSLLPAFKGARAVRDALEYGVKVTGATVHLVEPEVDAGAIVAQRPVEVTTGDDEVTLHDRIRTVEHELLPECVRLLCHGRITRSGRIVHVTPFEDEEAV